MVVLTHIYKPVDDELTASTLIACPFCSTFTVDTEVNKNIENK